MPILGSQASTGSLLKSRSRAPPGGSGVVDYGDQEEGGDQGQEGQREYGDEVDLVHGAYLMRSFRA